MGAISLRGILNGEKVSKFRELGLLVFIVILSVAVQLRNPSFMTVDNISDMLRNTVILTILALGMMLVIITRGIDLSIGSTLALSGMITALTVYALPDLNPFVVIVLGILTGLVCGSIVGLLVSKTGVLPIIASLGMMNIFRGLTFMVSGGRWVSAHQMPDSFKSIATGSTLGVNNMLLLLAFILVVFYYFVNYKGVNC